MWKVAAKDKYSGKYRSGQVFVWPWEIGSGLVDRRHGEGEQTNMKTFSPNITSTYCSLTYSPDVSHTNSRYGFSSSYRGDAP